MNALARANGTYAMVAMDQRESLRTMFRERGFDDSDERTRMFKTAVARELAPHASGFLVERQFLDDVRPFVPRGLILAVDLLEQERGGIVEDTRLDEIDTVPEGVVALSCWSSGATTSAVRNESRCASASSRWRRGTA